MIGFRVRLYLAGLWLADVLCLPESDFEPGAERFHEPVAEEDDLPFAFEVNHRLPLNVRAELVG